jgi:hypothetical protein
MEALELTGKDIGITSPGIEDKVRMNPEDYSL